MYSQNDIQSEHVLCALSSTTSKGSNLAADPYSVTKSSIHTSSKLADSSAFVSDALCGLTGQGISSTANFGEGINGGWRMSELIGAIGLASTLTAGSLLWGPLGDIQGPDERVNGGSKGGNNGPGGGGNGQKKLGSTGGGQESKFEEDNEPQVTVGIATVPPAYEVSSDVVSFGCSLYHPTSCFIFYLSI
jgi:hypothetical protein